MNRVILAFAVSLVLGASAVCGSAPMVATRPAVTMPMVLDYEGHAAKLRAALPAEAGLKVVVEKPFVIVGDVPADQMALAQRTTQWTVQYLRRDFLVRDPEHLVDIFIFKDRQSFDKNSKGILHQEPDTEFGFTTTTSIAINWATGGGTLVSEIVHPFLEANFPKCPPWFNEGLASLYEQSTAKDGHIVGMTNWRLGLLQETLAGVGPKPEGPAPSFKALCAMDGKTFNGAGQMPNTGTARYLLYYLQEKGVLLQFYADFVKNQKEDPTGYDTLQKTLAGLGEKDMGIFRRRWEAWVMGLTYP